jgi:heptosyltransferase II
MFCFFSKKKSSPKSIIIRMPNWLGDFVMAIPCIDNIRLHWPDAHLTVMCMKGFAPILEKLSSVDTVLGFTPPKSREEKKRLYFCLKENSYDLGILLTHSFSSAWWFWRGGIKKRWGRSKDLRSFLLTKAYPFPKKYQEMHHVEVYLEFLEQMGIAVKKKTPELRLGVQEIEEAKSKFLTSSVKDVIYVGIHPSAAYGPAKVWPLERFHSLAKELLKFPRIELVYLGDNKALEAINKVYLEGESCQHNLAGKTSIRELMALLKCCQLFITNDSGPMHLAAALKVPLVSLFGSTDPTRTSPYKWGDVMYKKVSCSPCFRRVCPIDFPCMMQIQTQEVLAKCLNQLRASNADL